MNIKTITADDIDTFDEQYNEFAKTHDIRFTQTHLKRGGFNAVIFYETDKPSVYKNTFVAPVTASVKPEFNQPIPENTLNSNGEEKREKWGRAYFKETGTFNIYREGETKMIKAYPHIDEFEKKGEHLVYTAETGERLFFMKNKFKKAPNQPDYIIYLDKGEKNEMPKM
ncbi:MAG: hypothetical protein AABY22_27145 [Nanoarchaeota archaeon]